MRRLLLLFLLAAAPAAFAQLEDWTPHLGCFGPDGGLYYRVSLGYLSGGEGASFEVFLTHEFVTTADGISSVWRIAPFESWVERRGGVVYWQEPNGQRRTLDPAHPVTSGTWSATLRPAGEIVLRDVFGQTLLYRRGRLARITSTAGGRLDFRGSDGSCEVLHDDHQVGLVRWGAAGVSECRLGRTDVHFTYDAQGRLVGAAGANGLVDFECRYRDELVSQLRDGDEHYTLTWKHHGWSATPVLASDGANRYERLFTRRFLQLSQYSTDRVLTGRLRLDARAGAIYELNPITDRYVKYVH